MGTIKLNVNGINSQVKPPLNYSIKDLDASVSIISSISIPTDFAYASALRSTISTINNAKQKIRNIYKWADNVTVKFQQAEQKNASILNAIAGNIARTNIEKIGAKIKNAKDIGMEASKETLSIIASTKTAITTGAEIVTNKCKSIYENAVEDIKLTKAKIATEVDALVDKMQKTVTEKMSQIQELTTKALVGINFVGCEIAGKVENFYKAKIEPGLEKAIDFVAALIADAGNLVLSVFKGLGQFLESLVDLACIADTMSKTTKTVLQDVITYLLSKKTGTTEVWESETAQMWKETMTFVAEDHVGNAFKSFYENTVVGRWLDEHAHEWFKSDGTVSEIISGIGYIGGIILLSIATFGVGGAAVGATSAATMTATTSAVAGLSATGKYTAEYWEKVRDSSWEGVEGMYKSGDLSEEQYRSLQEIRNLSDEQWEEFTVEYEKGNISKEDYEMIKQIREIPEDWTTFENATKGMGYGVANGAWESAQWYVGGKLGSWTMQNGSKLATSAIRIGVDTGFNALDTPFRTTIDAITSDKSWQEAWQNQGGWFSVLTNVGIGLLGSVGGEAIDFKNTNLRGVEVDSLDNVPESMWTDVKNPEEFSIKVNGKELFYEDFVKLQSNDVTALLGSVEPLTPANVAWATQKWTQANTEQLLHNLFDGYFGQETVDRLFKTMNVVNESEWANVILSKKLDPGTQGFVDSYGQLFLPSSATQHTVVHEFLHKLSELNGNRVIDANGVDRKVTGIREFFQNGSKSEFANETLTEYLTSKYTDALVYGSKYGSSNVWLWDRIDNAMQQTNYREFGDVLFNSYISNDTSMIRQFFDNYAYSGAYDDFWQNLEVYWSKSEELEAIISQIEKSVYKENHPILGIIKNIFGGGV